MNRDRKDRDRLVESYHYLCARAARKFLRDGIERADLEQIGAIGLIKAADRYDAAVGTPFEAYAWVMILGELMHYVRDGERLMRAPRRLRDLERRWAAGERELWVLLGREPNASEIGTYAGLSAQEQDDVRRYRSHGAVLSVETLTGNDQRSLAYTMEAQADRVAIDHGLATLSPVERQIVVEIYENDTPIVELARRLGYSRRHVTRLHRGALQKLAKCSELTFV